jgi:hypothetical protein
VHVTLGGLTGVLTAFELHTVDHTDDGRLETDVVAPPDRVTRGAPEDDEDTLADVGADGIDGHQGLRRVRVTSQPRLYDQEPQPLERLLLLGGPHLPYDCSDQHQLAPSERDVRQLAGASGTLKSSTIPTMAASKA